MTIYIPTWLAVLISAAAVFDAGCNAYTAILTRRLERRRFFNQIRP